jgi:transposase-like protein
MTSAKQSAFYSAEFRAEAVRLARSSGKPNTQIARDLGVTTETLRKWLKQADRDEGKRQDGLTSEEREELRRLRRENRILREEREILKKAAAHLPLGRPTRPGEGLGVCGAGEGHPSGASDVPGARCFPERVDVAWRRREPSARRRVNAQLTGQIVQIHQQSRGTYGALRVQAELTARGLVCGHNRVARLMRQAGLVGCHRRRPSHVRTTKRDPATTPAPDLVQRSFTASAPDRLWIADITYLPTEQDGFLFLAVILDVFSRRVVGWSMQNQLRTDLVLAAASDGGGEAAAESGADSSLRSWLKVTPPCALASGVRRWGSTRRWEPSATALTMPWSKASLQPWSASCWPSSASGPTRRHEQWCLSGSRAFITGNGGIRHWDM